MKLYVLALLVTAVPLKIAAQTKERQLPAHPNEPATENVETEKIVVPGQAPPSTSAQVNAPGRLEIEQEKALAHRIWLAQYRLNDLLSQVQPDKWKMAPAARQSFDQSLDSLRQAMTTLESWRGQFENRPDSMYLGFMTYVSAGAVLPRVDGVAHSVAHYENGSFAAQFSQAGNQLFDLQQTIEPHLALLLKNQDNVLLVSQNNLASCQNELNYAEHDKEGHAVPMRNIAPAFRGHGRAAHTGVPATNPKPAETKTAADTKPAASSGNGKHQK